MMPEEPDPAGSAIAGQPPVLLPNPELIALAASSTAYNVWCEQPEGEHGAVRYIAQRRPGVSGHLYCLVTRDFGELKELLA